MIKSPKVTSVICGLVTMFVTVIVYLYAFENIFAMPIQWVSLMLLLISEGILLAKALCLKRNIFSVANIVTSSVQWSIAIVLALIFVAFIPNALKTYIFLNTLVFCGLIVADVVIIHFGSRVSMENNKRAGNMKVMDECHARAKVLLELYNNSEHKKDLAEVVDMLKYADNSELTGDEVTILEKIEELINSKDNVELGEKIKQLKNEIKMRNIKVSTNKRGSF